MKKALIDLGSNTIRLSVYHADEDRHFSLLFSQKEFAGLATYITDRRMSRDGFDKACSTIVKFKGILSNFGISEMDIFATASLRNIKNTDEAVKYIFDVTGENVTVLSGEEEAELGYRGALLNTDISSGVIFDIGGGSTEIVKFRDRTIVSAESCEIGSLNQFNTYVSEIWPNKAEIKNIKLNVKAIISSYENDSTFDTICGIGGTNRALISLANAYFKKPLDNDEITSEEFKALQKIILKRDDTAKKLILKNCPNRIHTIIPGMLITDEIMKNFDYKRLLISRNGVREGYLCQRML
ncbi:MAG: phosphatase [Clostridiales bacterium]|nr:phosphatase [Clostridiales bacterium]